MKKLLLASAVAALSVSAAQAAPTIYGKAFLTLDYLDGEVEYTNKATNDKQKVADYSRTKLNSNSSRIGIKGSEALTANTDLVYQLEYGVDVDSSSDQFYARDTYLGLSNKQVGTLVAGRLTAIDDQINYAGRTQGLFTGYSTGFSSEEPYDVANGLAIWDGERADNAFAYFSPSFDGAQFMAMHVLKEDGDSLETGTDGFGLGVKYEPQGMPFKAGATYIKSHDFNSARVSGAFDVTPEINVGALYQITDTGVKDAKKENLVTVSGEMQTVTPWTAYAQGDFVKNRAGVEDLDGQRVVVGGKYAFNSNTTGHVYGGYSRLEADDSNDKLEASGFGIGGGLEYKF